MANKFNRKRVEKATWRYGVISGATGVHGLGKWIPSGALVEHITIVGAATGLSGATGCLFSVNLGTKNMATGITATHIAALRVRNAFTTTAFSKTGATGTWRLLSSDAEVKVNFTKNVVKGAMDIYVEYIVP